MNPETPTEPSAVPPPTPPPQRASSFGRQALGGFIFVGLWAAAFFIFKAEPLGVLGLTALPIVGIILCLVPGLRGLGCGILLGVGIGALVLFSICMSGLSHL